MAAAGRYWSARPLGGLAGRDPCRRRRGVAAAVWFRGEKLGRGVEAEGSWRCWVGSAGGSCRLPCTSTAGRLSHARIGSVGPGWAAGAATWRPCCLLAALHIAVIAGGRRSSAWRAGVCVGGGGRGGFAAGHRGEPDLPSGLAAARHRPVGPPPFLAPGDPTHAGRLRARRRTNRGAGGGRVRHRRLPPHTRGVWRGRGGGGCLHRLLGSRRPRSARRVAPPLSLPELLAPPHRGEGGWENAGSAG